MNERGFIREETDRVRAFFLEELYRLAREGAATEFIAAFDRYEGARAREVEAWRKIATAAVNCQTSAYVIKADGALADVGAGEAMRANDGVR